MSLFPDLPEITDAVAEPSDADYAQAARYALERKQLPRAIEQVAGAIALAPETRSHRELLERIAAQSARPLELLRLREEGSFYGIAAARAWLLLRAGELEEALELLAGVLEFQPNARFVAWLNDPALKDTKSLSVRATIGLLQALGNAVRREPLDSAGIENVSLSLKLAAEVAARDEVTSDREQHGALLGARVQLLRFTGNDAPALELASGPPACWEGAILSALIHRDRQQPGKQLEALRAACALRPEEPSTWLDRGMVAVEVGELQEAHESFRRAAAQGGGALADAACAYLGGFLGDEGAWERLGTLADDPSARVLQRDVEAYERLIPDPFDPTVIVMRTALTELARHPDRAVQLEASIDEAVCTSARLAFHLGAKARAVPGRLIVSGANGVHEVSAEVHPSSPSDRACSEAQEALSELAHTRFRWAEWLALARAHIERSPDMLLAAMRGYRSAPESADPVQWLAHLHVAAAMILGQQLEAATVREALLDDEDPWLRLAGVIAWAVACETGLIDDASCQARLAPLLERELAQPTAAARALAIVGLRCLPDEHASLAKLRARCAFSLLQGA